MHMLCGLAPTLTCEFMGDTNSHSGSPCVYFGLIAFTKVSRSKWTDRLFIKRHSDLPKRHLHTHTCLHTVFGLNELKSRNGTSRDSNERLRVTIVSAVLPLQPTREHPHFHCFLMSQSKKFIRTRNGHGVGSG